MTEIQCVDCDKEYQGAVTELPIRCKECGGEIRLCDEFKKPEDTKSDKI